MISVKKATEIVLANALPLHTKTVCLERSIGCILQEDIYADRDFPPFDRATMDGIAIVYEIFSEGARNFEILDMQAAGQTQINLWNKNGAIEIMTGAILPKNTDTIVRYEDISIVDKTATINIDAISRGQNVHFRGKDRRAGDLLLSKGCRISAAEIATLATIGKSNVRIAKPPKTAIIATGDELVQINEIPLAHQIRQSNAPALQAMLKQFGVSSQLFHLKDEEKSIFESMQMILKKYELIILSGGVSAGKFDFIPKILSALGVEEHFHQVAQRPGKPFWFGSYQKKAVVFALPGNPVSTFLCAHRYLLPWLRASMGLKSKTNLTAFLEKNIVFTPNLTYFLPVCLTYKMGQLWASPLAGSGSGDLANLNEADAFMELPATESDFEAGSIFPIISYK